MTKLYIGNLPFSATEAEVRVLFEQHGKVDSVTLVTDRETGRTRRFGFVDMPRSDAQAAIAALKGDALEAEHVLHLFVDRNTVSAEDVAKLILRLEQISGTQLQIARASHGTALFDGRPLLVEEVADHVRLDRDAS